MASIRAKPCGKLFFDFRYKQLRCRETTKLVDNAANRKKLNSILKRIEAEIFTGTFVYGDYFPNSPMLEKLQRQGQGALPAQSICALSIAAVADQWLAEHEVEWRANYRDVVLGIINNHIKPRLGDIELGALNREHIVNFRNELTRYRTPGGLLLKPATINRVVTILKALVEQACAIHKLVSPFDRIKKLKEEKRHVEPFSLAEMNQILADVREDYRDYLLVKFFTGMRTAEIHGLKWKYIDFDRGELLVRETCSKGSFNYTKNDHSQREIRMTQVVRDALLRQQNITGGRGGDGLVFCTRNGLPIDEHNFVNRIWKPMLEDLGIPYRRPYNTRHTAATLMLAAGESPEWVAKQLGHANTQMLFTVYSRFVPNLTRNDGSAIDRLISNSVAA